MIISMYLLSLYLVIGQKLNIMPVFAMVGVAFIWSYSSVACPRTKHLVRV